MGVQTTGRNYTDEEIRSFVRDLEPLPAGDLTMSSLLSCETHRPAKDRGL